MRTSDPVPMIEIQRNWDQGYEVFGRETVATLLDALQRRDREREDMRAVLQRWLTWWNDPVLVNASAPPRAWIDEGNELAYQSRAALGLEPVA